MSRAGAAIPPDHRGMARAVGYLYALAPATYVVWDVLFSAGRRGTVLQTTFAALALAAAALLLSGRLDRSRLGVLEVALAGFPLLMGASASAGVLDGGPPVGFGLVAWSVPVAFACLDRVRAWRQAVWTAAVSSCAQVVLGTTGGMPPKEALGSALLVTAAVLGLAVVTLWLRGREARRAAQQRVLAEFGRRALVETDVSRLLDDAVATALALVPGEVALLLEHRPADGDFVMVAVRSAMPETPAAGFRFEARPGRPSWLALTSGEPLVISERRTDERFPLPPPWEDTVVSAVLVPVPDPDGAIWGLLRVQSSTRQEYTRADTAVLTGLATLVAGAVERVRTAELHSQAAVHDSLTGLPNRRFAMEELARLLPAGERDLAVVLVDLDDFKVVNDALGHSSGDELLQAVASRLSALLRPGQTVARLDGDAFVVLARGVPNGEEGLELARRLAAAWQEPFEIQGRRQYLSASAGVALPSAPAPAPAAGQRAAVALLGDASTAMYRARQRGRGQVELYDARLRAWSVRRMELEADLRRAMRGREFSVEYQPVVEAVTTRPVGVEALVRWHSPRRGTVEPAEFIPVAERLGLIVPLGAWVLEEAARTVAQWQRAGVTGPDGAALHLAVNVSPVQLADPAFPGQVATTIDRTGLVPGSLGLEVTEGVLLEDLDKASAALRALVAAGARVLLDDFGTGHSSLAYLHRFPLQAVKIDRSFVARLGSHAPADAIVGAVVQMARTLDLEVIAEGIESPDQRTAVLEHGVGLLQGDGIAPAMPGPVVLDWLASAMAPGA